MLSANIEKVILKIQFTDMILKHWIFLGNNGFSEYIENMGETLKIQIIWPLCVFEQTSEQKLC